MAEQNISNQIRIVPKKSDLSGNTPLWRYMRLSAFLMLLRGKVFIPTIAELQKIDPNEARRYCKRTSDYFFELPTPDREWLFQRGSETEQARLTLGKLDAKEKAKLYATIWDRELGKRRTVWCWHASDIESMALWHIYGNEGVAVRTTPSRLMSAFDPVFVDTALIARVSYPQVAVEEAEPHHFLRPYLLKQQCYKHEQEVRMIFPRDPEDEERLLPVDARKLVDRVVISPNIPKSEASELKRSLIQAWRTGEEWEEREDDPWIRTSITKTFFTSIQQRMTSGKVEKTGITSFGSAGLPFAMQGDFNTSPESKY